MKAFLQKMKGGGMAPPPPGKKEIILAFLGSSCALGCIGLLHSLSMNYSELPLLMAPFGASAVLVFGAFRSPLAQPRNVIGGHVLSACVGITVYTLVGDTPLLAICCAVPCSIALMHLTQTLHPPGGATAFVTAMGGSSVDALGYWYVLTPCAVGSVLMICIALVINNIPKHNKYPQFWL